MGAMDLPPGPSTPTAVQTLEWVARPTALMRRCAARYGDVFTVRTMWMDAPMVFVSRPDDIKRVFAARPDVMTAGASSRILEPLVGPRSILLLDGDDHMRERKQMLPPFHGEALARWQGTIAELAEAELDSWEPGSPVRALGRMQALTLEVILRVVFGGPDPELRDAIRRVLDVGGSLPRMISMVVSPPGSRPWASFDASVARLDDLLEARQGRGLLPDRDQLVTLLAAGHETTAGALAWAVERLARHPEALERIRTGDDAWLDAVVK
jgi:cytochrome P450